MMSTTSEKAKCMYKNCIRRLRRFTQMKTRRGGPDGNGGWFLAKGTKGATETCHRRSADRRYSAGQGGRLSRLDPGIHAQVVDFPHIARGKMFFGGRQMAGCLLSPGARASARFDADPSVDFGPLFCNQELKRHECCAPSADRTAWTRGFMRKWLISRISRAEKCFGAGR